MDTRKRIAKPGPLQSAHSKTYEEIMRKVEGLRMAESDGDKEAGKILRELAGDIASTAIQGKRSHKSSETRTLMNALTKWVDAGPSENEEALLGPGLSLGFIHVLSGTGWRTCPENKVLRGRRKIIFFMNKWLGIPSKEIACYLKISVRTVENTIFLARRQLANQHPQN